MVRIALIMLVGFGAAKSALAQEQEQRLHLKTSFDYGIPKDILDLSDLRHCQDLEGQWPLLRINTASIQKQKCFRDDARNDRVTVVSLFNHKKKLVGPLAIVFEEATDSAAPIGRKKYKQLWSLVNEGSENEGIITKQWRVFNGDITTDFRSRADEIFRKLCTHYKLKCLLPQ